MQPETETAMPPKVETPYLLLNGAAEYLERLIEKTRQDIARLTGKRP